MIKDGFTSDHDEWRNYIDRNFYFTCITSDEIIKRIGKFCVQPSFIYDNYAHTVKTYLYETKEELYKALSKFEVIYVIYQGNMNRLGNFEPYLVRGIQKEDLKLKEIKNSWMFVQDHDGHWYKIPVSLKSQFEEWIEFCEKPSCQYEEGDYNGPDFDKYRSMHPCNYMFKEIETLKETK